MFRSDEEKAQRAADKERKAFEATPQGQARVAFQRGDGYFEIELDLRRTGNLNSHGGTGSDPRDFWNRPQSGRMDTLSLIESEGWRLSQANHIFVQTGEDSRDKWTASGQRVAIKGKIVGIYLFSRDEKRVAQQAM
ncbi:hypothetical protein GCM10009530_63050 [Microbispora corallina]|uniref:Single-stranded DNA-binding protein n=1 Tax=Microbispora corallina TaxID=83302 RepID=A0ABQ4GCJ6_9ACTN|nr:hypothetical protein [Microbispora corallina]GIH44806.1 hypothetical protein Mco01_78060 [Microbispora corallina]